MRAGSQPPPEGRGKRLLWFVLMYLASLGAFTVLVYGLRWLVSP
ncbi:MAG TPA: hypothetical protein VEZ16_03975 [Microvirga sp.]|nr:hypothetical protein [Microvirga sp.]